MRSWSIVWNSSFCLGQNDYSSGRCFCLSGLLLSLVQTVVHFGTVIRMTMACHPTPSLPVKSLQCCQTVHCLGSFVLIHFECKKRNLNWNLCSCLHASSLCQEYIYMISSFAISLNINREDDERHEIIIHAYKKSTIPGVWSSYQFHCLNKRGK